MKDAEILIKSKRLSGDDGYRSFSIRIKKSTVERLEKLCAESGYSRNEMISILIDNGLNMIKIEPNNK
jgi:hypothetical protein